MQSACHRGFLTLDGMKAVLLQSEGAAEFVEALGGLEFAAEEGLHLDFELLLVFAGSFELLSSDFGLFLLPLDLRLGGLDAAGDLVLIPLDTFELRHRLLQRTLHHADLPGEL